MISDIKKELEQMNVEVLSEEYINAKTPISISCIDCGNPTEKLLHNIRKGQIRCKVCVYKKASKSKTVQYSEIIKELALLGVTPCFSENDNRNARDKYKIKCTTCENSIYRTMGQIRKGQVLCDECINSIARERAMRVKEGNSFLEHCPERSKFWNYELNGEIKPQDMNRKSVQSFWFICEHHGNFKTKLCNVSRGKWCPHCAKLQVESKMASTLKQVCKNVFPNTLWEAKLGCKSPKGYEMPYDIYVPELNLIIECQSEYHDRPRQKKLDKIKKQWAVDNGYEFVIIDHRDYELLDAVQIFFPYIKEIPDYVSFKIFTGKTNLNKAQELLNKGVIISEVARQLGVDDETIRYHVNRGNLYLPRTYINIKAKKPVAQFTLQGDFVCSFESISSASRATNIIDSSIISCAKGELKTAGGYKWSYWKN